MKKHEEAIKNAESNPQTDIPQSIHEIIHNCWHGDEVNNLIENSQKWPLTKNDLLFSRPYYASVNNSEKERFGHAIKTLTNTQCCQSFKIIASFSVFTIAFTSGHSIRPAFEFKNFFYWMSFPEIGLAHDRKIEISKKYLD